MNKLPSIELATKISEIMNYNRDQLPEYQDDAGNINFNLLVGLVLGCICSFSGKNELTIKHVIQTFTHIFNEDNDELEDYVYFMADLNNYLVDSLDTNPNNICLLEYDKWISVADVSRASLYALSYTFFGIMQMEFEQAKDNIKLLEDVAKKDLLECQTIVERVLYPEELSHKDIQFIRDNFVIYAHKFRKLRELMYMQLFPSQGIVD